MDRAGETWRKVLHELESHGVKFPNNFDSIGAAYGSGLIIKEALKAQRQEIIEQIKGMKQKEVEISGHIEVVNPVRIKRIRIYNQALDDLIEKLK